MTLSIPSDIWKPEFQAIMCQNVLFLLDILKKIYL